MMRPTSAERIDSEANIGEMEGREGKIISRLLSYSLMQCDGVKITSPSGLGRWADPHVIWKTPSS